MRVEEKGKREMRRGREGVIEGGVCHDREGTVKH